MATISLPQTNGKNEFNLNELRLGQDFQNMANVKKIITSVRVDKPAKHVFFRVRPGEDWTLTVYLLELKEERETYVVHPSAFQYVSDLAVPKVLFTCITRNGDLFLFPVKLPGFDGRSDSWNDSRLAATTIAQGKWVRIVPNMAAGVYDVYEATGNIPEPEWPAGITLEELIRTAFNGKIIDSSDHPVVKRVRGES